MMKRETILDHKRVMDKMDYLPSKQTFHTLIDSHLEALDRIRELESIVVDQIKEEALPDFAQIDPIMTMRGWITSDDKQVAPSTRRAITYRKPGKGMIDLSFLPNGQLDKACIHWGTLDWERADGNVLQVLEWSKND